MNDLRYAARTLMRNPGFALVAVITLALGIGANTAIFSVLNAALLRPLPWPGSDRLVRVYESNISRGWDSFSASGPNFLDWRRQVHAFDQLAAWRSQTYTLAGREGAEKLDGGAVTAALLPMLGVTPALGRGFLPEEDRVGGNGQVAMVSHRLWTETFSSDPEILGRSIALNGTPYTVVGVLPSGFQWVYGADILVPLEPILDDRRRNHVLSVFGHLAPGATLDQARAEMDGIARGLAAQYPEMNREWSVRLVSFYDWILNPGFRRSLLMLAAAVGLVLLIACANVANLLLARAAGRQREVAIRAALGAGRMRLARQFVTESLLLSVAGGGLGLLGALWGIDLLRGMSPGNLPRVDETRIDPSVLLFTMVVSVLTGLLFGLVPALQASRASLNDALKEGGRTGEAGVRHRLKSALVVAELALSLLLLVGAGLLARSFWTLSHVDPGFDPKNLITMQISLPHPKYAMAARSAEVMSHLLERVSALPGVKAAAAGSLPPFGFGNTAFELEIEGRSAQAGETAPSANWRMVTPGYFRTLGVPLIAGRVFDDHDVDGAPPTVVISDTLARRFWPGQDPLGRRLRSNPANPWMTVVGVVGDVRNTGLAQEIRATLYMPAYQSSWTPLTLLVRGSGDPAALTASIRAEVKALDAELPVSNVQKMDDMIADSLAQTRFSMTLLAVFAGVALALATVGVYGVMAFAVTQRTHEFGVRVALGARQADVLKLVLSHALKLALLGVAIGLAASFVLTSLLSTLLFGVTASDPYTFATVALLLSFVTLAASWIPARRATRVDPMVALRCE